MIEALSGIFLALAFGSESTDSVPDRRKLLEGIPHDAISEAMFLGQIGEIPDYAELGVPHPHPFFAIPTFWWTEPEQRTALLMLVHAWLHPEFECDITASETSYWPIKATEIEVRDGEFRIHTLIGHERDVQDLIEEKFTDPMLLEEVDIEEQLSWVTSALKDWLYEIGMYDEAAEFLWANKAKTISLTKDPIPLVEALRAIGKLEEEALAQEKITRQRFDIKFKDLEIEWLGIFKDYEG